MHPHLHTDFSRGRSGGLVFPCLSEFSTVYCDPHKGFGMVNKAEIDVLSALIRRVKRGENFLSPSPFFPLLLDQGAHRGALSFLSSPPYRFSSLHVVYKHACRLTVLGNSIMISGAEHRHCHWQQVDIGCFFAS